MNKQNRSDYKDVNSEGGSPPEQPPADVYIYDPETRKWKVHNPSGSIAYNCLTRDQWDWLD